MPETRRLQTAQLLAVGAELLVGETRDTNSGDLAAELTALGVEVGRLSALPDRLPVVADALRDALARADLVVTTGGLGPTPDDLTRESIAAVCGEEPAVDPEIEAWLRSLFSRRGIRFAEANVKQAWRIPSATALPNAYGTAPGWWVDRPDGRVILALPGPPRELKGMWRDEVLPRLRARGLGADRAAETLRLTGIGESLLVDLIGEEVLRTPNPEVATYARADAVDVRVSATGSPERSAREMVDATVAALLPRLGPYVFARGDAGWPEAVGARIGRRTLAVVEIGTAGQVSALLARMPLLTEARAIAPRSPLARTHRTARAWADAARTAAGTDLALAVVARERQGDMAVRVAVAGAGRTTEIATLAFLAGDQGRRRAANAACAELWARLAPPTRGAGAARRRRTG